MNYKELLKQYMIHVIKCGGISFVESHSFDHIFPNEDIAELRRIEKQINRELYEQ